MAGNDAGLVKKGGSGGGFYPNLASDAEKCREFLVNFTDDHVTGSKPYLLQLQDIADRKTSILNISIDHLKLVREANTAAQHASEQHTRCAENEKSNASTQHTQNAEHTAHV